MRKLENNADKERRERRKKQIVMVILLGLLVMSSAGFAFSLAFGDGNAEGDSSGTDTNPDANGAGSDGSGFLKYSYDDVKNISVEQSINSGLIQGKLVYIAGEDNEAIAELETGISGYAGRIQRACYGSCTQDLPEKNCSDTLIVIRNSETQKVTRNESCIFIDGNSQAVDAFIYSLSGINKQ